MELQTSSLGIWFPPTQVWIYAGHRVLQEYRLTIEILGPKTNPHGSVITSITKIASPKLPIALNKNSITKMRKPPRASKSWVQGKTTNKAARNKLWSHGHIYIYVYMYLYTYLYILPSSTLCILRTGYVQKAVFPQNWGFFRGGAHVSFCCSLALQIPIYRYAPLSLGLVTALIILYIQRSSNPDPKPSVVNQNKIQDISIYKWYKLSNR